MPDNHGNSRRRYVRLRTEGCFGDLQIKAIGTHPITSNSRKVLIDDISPGGLRFSSGLRFPANRKVRVLILTTILGIRLEAEGLIVWRRSDENMYEYGVMFEITELHRSFLIRMLNQLYLQQRPEEQRMHQYYTYMCNLYLQAQKSKINYTV